MRPFLQAAFSLELAKESLVVLHRIILSRSTRTRMREFKLIVKLGTVNLALGSMRYTYQGSTAPSKQEAATTLGM